MNVMKRKSNLMDKEYECYDEEVQPYRKTEYKPILYIYV